MTDGVAPARLVAAGEHRAHAAAGVHSSVRHLAQPVGAELHKEQTVALARQRLRRLRNEPQLQRARAVFDLRKLVQHPLRRLRRLLRLCRKQT